MQKPIYLNALRHTLDPIGKKGHDVPFDIVVCKKNGQLVRGTCICTSSFFEKDTINLKFVESGETRKFKAYLIFKYNGYPVIP